jgi:LmbE family N-acetylglucosaminyl deacetylase
MTGHAAHKDVSAWATKALHEVGKPGSKVLYATVTPEFASRSSRSGSRSTSSDREPHRSLRATSLPSTTRCPEDILALKVNAINAHVSQVEAIVEAVGPELWWRQMSVEAFRPGEERT